MRQNNSDQKDGVLFLCVQLTSLSWKLYIYFVKVSCETAVIPSHISTFRLFTGWGLTLLDLHFKLPHKKKSQTDRSGEFAGQWILS